MNKKQLTAKVSRKTEMTAIDVQLVIDALCEVIKEALIAGDNVKIQDFGKFERSARKEAMARNPKHPGQEIKVPAHFTPVWRPGKDIKVRLRLAS